MRRIGWVAALGSAALILAACADNSQETLGGGSKDVPPKVPVAETRDGTQQHVVLASRVDGADVSFELFEPDRLEAGKTYPLVLHGHGYGGSRQTTRDGFLGRLTAAGYYAISFDQRGFGASGGTIRVMDPEYDGQDLIQILDYAEDLPGLRRRADGGPYVGSYGGSYGGMYQLLLAGADPRHRLRVLAPDITPHDLVYALNPNGVVKSGWGLVLAAGGDVLANGSEDNFAAWADRTAGGKPLRQDAVIYETLIQAILTNNFGAASRNLFAYHSVRYFCDGAAAGPQDFVYATPDALTVPPTPYPALDVLVTQGFRDTLFNFNDGYNNYRCLKRAGGDVRLLTHQSGHILPVGISQAPGAEDGLDPFYAALTVPGFQDAGGSRSCGNLKLDDAQFAWFEDKLQGKAGATDAAIASGRDVCLSLAEGDAVAVAEVPQGGTRIDLALATPQFNSALGAGGTVLGNGAREALLANVPLYTAPAGGAILAGLPTMDLSFAGLSGLEPESCTVPLAVGACDPMVFLALGVRKAGTERWDIVDDQITPLRGFGAHAGAMNGVAERLAEGDELALLIYGFHAQFPITWSRDVLVPALEIGGSIGLPLLSPGEVRRNGV